MERLDAVRTIKDRMNWALNVPVIVRSISELVEAGETDESILTLMQLALGALAADGSTFMCSVKLALEKKRLLTST